MIYIYDNYATNGEWESWEQRARAYKAERAESARRKYAALPPREVSYDAMRERAKRDFYAQGGIRSL